MADSTKAATLASAAAKAKAKVEKVDGKWQASDPAGLDALLAKLDAANSLNEVKAIMAEIITALHGGD